MFGALGNLLPPLDKLLKADTPALLLQVERLLTSRSNANDDSHHAQSTRCRKEEIGVLCPAHADDGSVGEGQDEVEEFNAGGEVAVGDSRAVSGGTEAACEGLIGDGTQRGDGESMLAQ